MKTALESFLLNQFQLIQLHDIEQLRSFHDKMTEMRRRKMENDDSNKQATTKT